jgi:hypothetical protein
LSKQFYTTLTFVRYGFLACTELFLEIFAATTELRAVTVTCTFGPPRAHLAPDDEGPEALLGRGGGDDEAQPHREDDAEGDGGGGKPSRHSQPRVHARHPVRPAAETSNL